MPNRPVTEPLIKGVGLLGAVLMLVDLLRPNPARATAATKALHITLEAKPGAERLVERLLEDIRGIVEDEPGTRPWYGTHVGGREYAIFETFPSNAARSRHLSGPGARLLLARAPAILARPPVIRKLDVLVDKAG